MALPGGLPVINNVNYVNIIILVIYCIYGKSNITPEDQIFYLTGI